MKSKYLMGRFGVCPRVLCERQNVLPVGMSYELRTSRVKVYILKNYRKKKYYRYIVPDAKMYIHPKKK